METLQDTQRMRLKELIADDDAVSPVIGVILMVAITVILAAVIASFVLGLGNQTQTTPQASMSVDYSETGSAINSNDGNLTITHDSGDPIVDDELYVRGDNFCNAADNGGADDSWPEYDGACTGGTSTASSTATGSTEGETAVVAGNRLKTGADSNYDINVVFEASEGDASATIASDEGPDA
jgi:flagellin-like protein